LTKRRRDGGRYRPPLRGPGQDHSIPVQMPRDSGLTHTQGGLRGPTLSKTASSLDSAHLEILMTKFFGGLIHRIGAWGPAGQYRTLDCRDGNHSACVACHCRCHSRFIALRTDRHTCAHI
jgi:hypothetical protein